MYVSTTVVTDMQILCLKKKEVLAMEVSIALFGLVFVVVMNWVVAPQLRRVADALERAYPPPPKK